MRGEKELFELILTTARADARIRAAYLNGSRADPNAPRDAFQDYDIVYAVTETASFLADRTWLSAFGEPVIVQEPDAIDAALGRGTDFSRSYTWLMLFRDGVRVDLRILTKETAAADYTRESLTVLLLDKDGFLPAIPPPSDRDYLVKRPTAAVYAGCCNEFWWCLNNVAKGLARDELPYAMWMYNSPVHAMLTRMLTWKIGADSGFSVSAGKYGKYFKRYLPPALYEQYTQTFAGSDYAALRTAVFTACELFRAVAVDVAAQLGYLYHRDEDAGMTAYLKKLLH